jgi:uncharacterized protein YndB with AHSA1/START domain
MPTLDTKALEREIRIDAKPDTVFSFLVDPAKLRRWFVAQATTDPRAGGEYRFVFADPENVAKGKYIAVEPPKRLALTWGWEGDDAPTPVGSTTGEITLKPDGGGTLLKLSHRDFPSDESRERHGHGWEKYLQRLSIAATGGDPGPDTM